MTSLLSSVFRGEVVIGHFDHIGPYSVIADNIRVRDPDGNEVLRVTELKARANLAVILRDVLFGGGDLTIWIEHVRIERAEGFIIPDPETGVPTLADAFTPASSTDVAEQQGEEEEPDARAVRVWLPDIEVGRAWARGSVAGLPTMEATARKAHGSVLVTPESVTVDVQRFGLAASGLGGADARGTAALRFKTPSTLWTAFDGYFGDVQVGARVHLANRHLRVALDSPRVLPDEMRALWSDWPLYQPIHGVLEVRGVLPMVETTGKITVGDGTLNLHGPLNLSRDYSADLNVEGNGLDLRAVIPDAPATSIDANAQVSVWDKQGQPVVSVQGRTQPTVIEGHRVPALDVTGTYDGRSFKARALVEEPGVPATLDFELWPEGILDARLVTKPFRLEQAERFKGLVEATGQVQADISARVEGRRVRAVVVGDLRDLAMGETRLSQGRLRASLNGSVGQWEQFQVSAILNGDKTSGFGMSFDEIQAEAQGAVASPRVSLSLRKTDGASVSAEARVRTQPKPSLTDVELRVVRKDRSVHAKAEKIRVEEGRIEIDSLALEQGAAKVEGSVRIGPDRVTVRVRGDDVDIQQFARILGVEQGYVEGTVRVDADIDIAGDEQSGHVRMALGDGSVMGVPGVAFTLDANLDGARLQGNLTTQVEGYGAANATWDATLAGAATELESWRDATGRAQINLGNLQLHQLDRLQVVGSRLDKIEGQAFAEVRVEREDSTKLPSVFMAGSTEGFGATVPGEEPVVLEGIDLRAAAGVSGQTGHIATSAQLVDVHGQLGSASGAARIDLEHVVTDPDRFFEQLSRTSVSATFAVPERPLSSFPESLRLEGLGGSFSGTLAVSGPISEPDLALRASLDQVSLAQGPWTRPLRVDSRLDYQTRSGRTTAHAEVNDAGRRVASVDAKGIMPWASQAPEPLPATLEGFRGEAKLSLDRLPLGLFTDLTEAEIDGTLSGDAVLEWREQPKMVAKVKLENGSVDYVPLGQGQLWLRSEENILNVRLRFNQGQGSLDTRLIAALDWKGGLGIAEDKPIQVELDASGYDAIVLKPVVKDLLSEISGRVDADLSLSLEPAPDPKVPGETRWTGALRGTASMVDGTVQLRGLGLQLDDVGFQGTASESRGMTWIAVRNFGAKARSESENVAATANLYFSGIELQSAQAGFSLSKVPVLVEGVSQASASGVGTVRVSRQQDQMSVEVNLPELTANLPRSTGRKVIPLSRNATIEIVQPLSKPEGGPGGQSLPWVLTFELGENVKITRNDLNIPLTGRPVLRLDDTTSMSGFLELEPGGRVSLLGRVFVIDRGVIRFDGEEATNPSIDITALWQSPTHVVTVHIRGTPREATLDLSSDPPLPEAEVTALLLGTGSSEGGGAAVTGAGLGASLFNDLFSGTPLDRVELRASTEAERENYTAAVQVSDSVWFEATYKSSNSSQTSGPGAADAPSGISGTVDWRFHRNWSLRSELGTLGAGFDMLWQYRY